MNNLFLILLLGLNFIISLISVYPMDKILTKVWYYSELIYRLVVEGSVLFISGVKILIDNFN